MTKILIPVELTFSVLNEAAAIRVNEYHTLIDAPQVAEGDLNPYRTMLADMAYSGNGFDRQSPMATSDNVLHPEHIDMAEIAIVLGLGGDIIEMPVFFELADLSVQCPFSLTTPKETWAQWGAPLASNVLIAGKYYRENAVVQSPNSGVLMPASVWYHVASGYTKTLGEFLTIQQENQVQIP